MNTTPFPPSLFKSTSADQLREKLVPLPYGLLNPRIGVANIPDRGVTVVVMGDLSPPMVYDTERKMWTELQC